MKAVLILALLAFSATAKFSLTQHSLKEKAQLFNNFIKNHNKQYADKDVFSYRFQVFQRNLERIAELQELSPETIFGATQFADLTEDEFVAQYLGYQQRTTESNNEVYQPSGNDVPDSWDWREHGAVTGVKNQGQCGSCWAFSTTGNLEGALQIASGTLTPLSEQQLVDCDDVDAGCNGGLMDNAFEWIQKNGGLESEEDYPYKGVVQKCHQDESKYVVTVTGWHDIAEGDESAMKDSIFNNGPLAVAIHANGLQFYVGGIFDPVYCSKQLNHGVLGVGFGTSDKGKDFWVIKNSWGAAWGEKGFFQIVRGKNKCGLANACSYADVKAL